MGNWNEKLIKYIYKLCEINKDNKYFLIYWIKSMDKFKGWRKISMRNVNRVNLLIDWCN